MVSKGYNYNCVMLIDDNELDNFINTNMMQSCNFAENIYVHTGGKSALELLNNFNRNPKLPSIFLPQVILLDINMPLMDGFQFLDELNRLPKDFLKDIKIVMLTTSTNPHDLERAKDYDMVIKFTNKPISEKVLLSI